MDKELEQIVINEFKSGALLKDMVKKYQITVYEWRKIRKDNNLEEKQYLNNPEINKRVIEMYNKNICLPMT